VGPGLNYVILVWFVYSCYPGSASLTHLHGFDEVKMHPYGHPLHRKVLKYFIYIQDGSVFQSEGVLGLTHVIVVWFVPWSRNKHVYTPAELLEHFVKVVLPVVPG